MSITLRVGRVARIAVALSALMVVAACASKNNAAGGAGMAGAQAGASGMAMPDARLDYWPRRLSRSVALVAARMTRSSLSLRNGSTMAMSSMSIIAKSR